MQLQPLSAQETPEYPRRSARWLRASAAMSRARRLGAAVVTSAALSLGACYVSVDGGDPSYDELVLADAGGHGGFVDDDAGGDDADGDGSYIDSDAGGDEADGDGGFTDGDADEDGGLVDATLPGIDWCEETNRLSGDGPTPTYPIVCSPEPPEDLQFSPRLEIFSGSTCIGETGWFGLKRDSPARIRAFLNYAGQLAVDIYGPDGTHVLRLEEGRSCAEFDARAGNWLLAVSELDPIRDEVYFEVWVEEASPP